MIVDEARMNEEEGLLISDASGGLGAHLASAFRRLGRRLTLVGGKPLPAALEAFGFPALKRESLSTWPDVFNTYFVTPHPALGTNRPLDATDLAAELAKARDVVTKSPQVHLVVVLPDTTPAADIDAFRALTAHHTVFLSPPVIGFLDDSLIQGSLQWTQDHPAAFLKSNGDRTFRWLYARDLVGLLVSTVGRADLDGLAFLIPATETRVDEFKTMFLKTFEFRPSLKESLLAWVTPARDDAPWALPLRAEVAVVAVNPFQHFPTLPTPLPRALKEMADIDRRHPGSGLLFPPGRAL